MSLNWTWVIIMAAIPALLAALNGTRSVSHIWSSLPSITGSSTWGSTGVLAFPGKCLAVAATPFDWKPLICATACFATCSGSVPMLRVPTLGLWILWVISMAGARFQLIPRALSSVANTPETRSVRSGSSAAPNAIAPGLSL